MTENATRGAPLSQPGDTLVVGEDVRASSFYFGQKKNRLGLAAILNYV
ncbi:hypothetical protein GCM10010912_29920 [Paenibacillus albidus]|uniref:Uncharacterized protein n=1 Tax=Paenibacillus albidus TaxID=2041023 RepID=A0A917FHY8_9BACL|nr:hypothetical protein GCM10010912_29920 [Paenibacillus albidus]